MKVVFLIFYLHFFYINLLDKRFVLCSPIKTSEKQLLDRFDFDKYIAVEGYYTSGTEFTVIRSTDVSVEVGNKYTVYEYGPFGSGCEMYEMATRIDEKKIGKQKKRILITYKKRSIDGKIVTPIFWEEGIKLYNNRTVISEQSDGVYTTSLKKIRQWLFRNKKIPLNWEKKVAKKNNE